MDEGLSTFKLQIFKYTFISAFVFGVASLPFLGMNVHYFYGLALGTCFAVINFTILISGSKAVLQFKKRWIAVVGYLLRLMLYGFGFYMSMRVGKLAGLACVFGFMTIKLALFYIYGVKTKFSKNRTVRPEVQEEFERMDQAKQMQRGNGFIDQIKRELNGPDDESDQINRREE